MHDYNWKRGVRSHFATASPDCGERINSGKTIFGRRSGSRQKGVLYTHPTACHRLGWSVRYYVGSRQARALIVPSETPCGFLSLLRRDHPHTTHTAAGTLRNRQLHHHLLFSPWKSKHFFPALFRHPQLSFNGLQVPTRSRIVSTSVPPHPTPPPLRYSTLLFAWILGA